MATEKRKNVAEKKEAARVTEKPVPSVSASATSQYVLTVDNSTGLVTKIEKLDESKGEKTELTSEQYAALMAYAGGLAAPYDVGLSAAACSMGASPLVQAYNQGFSDYLKALTPSK